MGLGQNNIYWNSSTASATSIPVGANYTVGSFSQNNNNGTTVLISTGSASTGYSFTLNTISTPASGTGNFGAAARTGTLSTSQSAYFEVTITPSVGYELEITSINFASRSTSTGPQNYSIQTNANGSFAQVSTGTLSSSGTWQYKTNALSLNSNSPITIRVYGYGGTGSPGAGTANWRIDDIVINASATLLPTIWNGTAWSNGLPNSTVDAIIDAVYTGASFTANNVTINPSKTLTIGSGQTVTANNVINDGAVIVNEGGNFILSSSGTYSGTGTFKVLKNGTSV